MPNISTHFQARRFLAAAKINAKRSHVAVSNLKNAIEETRKRLASLIEEKARGMYAGCVSKS